MADETEKQKAPTPKATSRGTSKGSYGISTPSGVGQSGRETSQTAQVAELQNGAGVIIEGTTKGSKTTIREDFHAGPVLPTLAATDGQQGAELITSMSISEKEGDYATYSKERTVYPGGDLNPAAS
jgi:hypothetical protein